MKLLRRAWAAVDELQKRPVVRVVLTVVALIAVGATFGRVYIAAEDARSRFNEVVEVLREAGVEVTGVIATIDRFSGARENVEAAGLSFDALFTVEDLGVDTSET